MTAGILVSSALVFLAGPLAHAAEFIKFNLTEGRAVSADPGHRDPRDGRSILLYFQNGRLFQDREPSKGARFCRFHLDPVKRPIDSDGEPPMTHFLMPGEIRFRVRSAHANGNRSLDLAAIGANESHLVRIHCEDPADSRAFADPASYAKILQEIWGDWMTHVPGPPPKAADCGVTPVVQPVGSGQLKALGEVISRSAEPPAADTSSTVNTANADASADEPDPSVFDSPGASEAWEEMQESAEESFESAASGGDESPEEGPAAGDSPGESEPLRCDSPPAGDQTPAALLSEEILASDPTVTMYLNLIRSAAFANPPDSRVVIWQILGRKAYSAALHFRIRAMTPEARKDFFQKQLDYLKEVDLYYLVCENAGGKP